MTARAILSHFERGERIIALHGATGSFLALVLAELARCGAFPRPLLVLTPDEDRAQELARDLGFFLGGERPGQAAFAPESSVQHLPWIETSPYAEISFDRAAMMQRMGVLFRLSQGDPGEVLVASTAAMRRRVMPRRAFADRCDLVQAEEELDRDEAVRRLLACGFLRTQVVEDPGTFSVRGGILDLFPPLSRYPVRLEFYGDLVESIRLFDPASQRTLRAIDEVTIHPVRETVPTSAEGLAAVRRRLLQAADEVNHPSHRTRALLEEVESGREFFGIEALTPAFHDGLEPLAAYLPEGGLWVMVDPEAIEQVLDAEEAAAESGWRARRGEGRLTFPPQAFFVLRPELQSQAGRRRQLQVRVTEAAGLTAVRCAVEDNADVAAELKRARAEREGEILKALVRRVRGWQAEGRPVLIAAGGPGHLDRLDALLRGHGLEPQVLREGEADLLASLPAAGQLQMRGGSLSAGFRLPGGLVVLVEQEIFGPKAPKRPPARPLVGVADLRELRDGDAVVHATHGVGIYRGLVQLDIQGVPTDFLSLEYQGGDRLYLPVYRMNQVQKFSAGDGVQPRLDRLGGVTWARKKGKVRSEVRQLAEELLQLYAQRAALQGHAFPAGDSLYAEFEATFPFEETPDQLRAVEEVLADLTAPRPTDRLICGDVGFGKTEVALRAAFLAAASGKQVAVLAPPPVGVEQHGRTFADRLASYPVRVATLSRFNRREEARRVLADLAAGKIDILIGTHRLLSPDVRFKDLGLLIIDEEQRFGVAHKERLKRLRTQVDVITMTATPIPRTLQMAMMGMREISIIATPPVDRLAIRTFICRYEDGLVAEGIRRELDRGGQVFFVHNRVESIHEWATRVSALVPEARVGVAHGQMEGAALEKVMVQFVAGEIQVLVCTAIIESGLDIPRANTMFINRADTFGLAQLYQLRGRIGRSRYRAFCYLLVPGIEAMSGDARQRLTTLQRFTELGSGFSVASHALELRGAGDLLGARQSGHIAAVGFETYARILEEAVAELRGQPIVRESDPEINARVPAYIPDDYVEDTGQRLELYKRLSDAAQHEDRVAEILSEMRDRYGERPPEVEALGELMVVKGLAAALGVVVLDLSESLLSLTIGEGTPLEPQRLVQLVSDRAAGFRLTPEMRLIRALGSAEQADPLAATRRVLHGLLAYANENR
jgi:transcription-repair coupling factor (superfamily II helicase)